MRSSPASRHLRAAQQAGNRAIRHQKMARQSISLKRSRCDGLAAFIPRFPQQGFMRKEQGHAVVTSNLTVSVRVKWFDGCWHFVHVAAENNASPENLPSDDLLSTRALQAGAPGGMTGAIETAAVIVRGRPVEARCHVRNLRGRVCSLQTDQC